MEDCTGIYMRFCVAEVTILTQVLALAINGMVKAIPGLRLFSHF
jgi:hypothetical protein